MSFPVFPTSAAAAVLIATAAGAFGTEALPPLQRLGFWTMLIGINTILWICWFTWRVRTPSDWWRAAAIGAIIVNLPLPFEIAAILRLLGGPTPKATGTTWLHAAMVSAAIFVVVRSAVVALRRPRAAPSVKGHLWRAGFRALDAITLISAEDHYCRVWQCDGTSRLIHARFSDLVQEVGTIDGATIRRGQWVASSAVHSIRREGRRWKLVVADGRAVPIAPSRIAGLRGRGWLARGGAGTFQLPTA